MDISYADFDNHYGAVRTNPSCFNSLALPNSAPEVLSHLEAIEQSGVAFKDTSGPDVNDITDLPNNVLVGAYDFETVNHFGVQSSMPNPLSGQPSVFPALSGSSQGHFPDPARSASALSALHHSQPNQTPVIGKAITRKRRRSPQGNPEKGMSATRRKLSKQSRVPETFLGTMWCSEPAPKSSRTTSQKQNKKAVENAGGACFLCLVLKKQVTLRLYRPLFSLIVLIVLGSTALRQMQKLLAGTSSRFNKLHVDL